MNATTATRKMTATEKRHDAIRLLADAVRTAEVTETGPVVNWHLDFAYADEVALGIRQLAPLGRTDRWQGAVESWAVAVETAEDQARFRHAFDQFGIWAAYAAE